MVRVGFPKVGRNRRQTVVHAMTFSGAHLQLQARLGCNPCQAGFSSPAPPHCHQSSGTHPQTIPCHQDSFREAWENPNDGLPPLMGGSEGICPWDTPFPIPLFLINSLNGAE